MKQFKVTQIRSISGRTKPVKDTLFALGLGSIGKSKVHTASPTIAGMVRRVLHLVKLEEQL
jgi:large subunit ribosomal protein L30